MDPHLNELTYEIIGAAIEVHRAIGPGLLESAYKACLCTELSLRGINFQTELSVPVHYKGIRVDCGYRIDVLVAELVVVEIKTLAALAPVHDAQLLTYLRLGGWKVGLLINFNVAVLKDGIHRENKYASTLSHHCNRYCGVAVGCVESGSSTKNRGVCVVSWVD